MSNNELKHHGVQGQKWGVRRYQNKDGSLTSAGKKHLSENSGGYLEAPRGSKYSIDARRALSGEYQNKFWETAKKYGADDEGDLPYGSSNKKDYYDEVDGLWNSYIDKYSDATLKDLGYKNSEEAHNFVKSNFSKSLAQVITFNDGKNNFEVRGDGYTIDGLKKKGLTIDKTERVKTKQEKLNDIDSKIDKLFENYSENDELELVSAVENNERSSNPKFKELYDLYDEREKIDS